MYGYDFGLTWNGGGGASTPTQSNWQTIKDTVTDVPAWFDTPTNTLMLGLEDMGFFSEADGYLIICIPSILDSEYALYEVSSGTIRANYNVSGGVPSTEALAGTFSMIDGYKMNSAWLDTNLVPSTEMTLNDHCVFYVAYKDETAPAGSDYNWGALNSINQFMGATSINNANNARSFSYATSQVAQGTTNAGDLGVYISNRRASNDFETVVNGTVVGTLATSSGSLPTRDLWINTFNNNNAPSAFRNQSRICAWGSFGRGLSSGEVTTLNGLFTTWQTSLKRRLSDKTKQIVFEGNSIPTYYYSAMQRAVQFNLSSDRDWHHETNTQGGKDLRTIEADYATDIAPLYNGSYTQNVYVLLELTNDYALNWNTDRATTVADVKQNLDDCISQAQATGYDVVIVGCPVRDFNNPGVTVPTQQDMNLGLDEIMQYARDQASIQGYTFVEPSSNYWVWRDDYGSDSAYDTACAGLFNNTTYFDNAGVHPNETYCISDWGALITTTIEGL